MSSSPTMKNHQTLLFPLVALCLLVGLACLATWAAPRPASRPVASTVFSPTPTASQTPSSTPTSSPTPSPSVVPTLEPSITFTLTPAQRPPRLTSTPPPLPTLPSEAQQPQGWPPLSADLYFIREGALWRWAKAGGLQPVVTPSSNNSSGGVIAYHLTPDGRYVAYAFVQGKYEEMRETQIAVLDQASGVTFPIPTAYTHGQYLKKPPCAAGFLACQQSVKTTPRNKFGGIGSSGLPPVFDITPDGRYLVYLAWNTLPTTLPAPESPPEETNTYGTLFAVDIHNINHEFELGYCAARTELWWEYTWLNLKCEGMLLSPDGKRVAFSDGRGIWIAGVPAGHPRLLVAHSRNQFCGIWRALAWSPNSQDLLAELSCYEGAGMEVLHINSGEGWEVPDTWRHVGYAHAVWDRTGSGLLVTSFEAFSQGTLAWVSAENAQETVIYESEGLRPTHAQELPDGTVVFAHQPCEGQAKLPAGVYRIAKDGTGLQRSAALPYPYCSGDFPFFGDIVWAPDGAMFLYLNNNQPLLLGWVNGSALWDVREALADAHHFQWYPPPPNSP